MTIQINGSNASAQSISELRADLGIVVPFQLRVSGSASGLYYNSYNSGSGGANINVDSRIFNANADGYGDGYYICYARGTVASPTAVQSGDVIGYHGFVGHDGTGYRDRAWITGVVDGAVSLSNVPIALVFHTGSTGAPVERLRITSAGHILASSGLGYRAGAGGTVTQATSKSTGVTLNKVTGAITLNGAALAAGASVSFTLTNSEIGALDLVLLQHVSGGTSAAYTINAFPAAGSAVVTVRNNTAGSLSEAIVLRFAVYKSANT